MVLEYEKRFNKSMRYACGVNAISMRHPCHHAKLIKILTIKQHNPGRTQHRDGIAQLPLCTARQVPRLLVRMLRDVQAMKIRIYQSKIK
jgi:hypothetical protein